MKRSGRESKGPPSADLLVCFPSRSHLTLMPKAICSPVRAGSERRHQNHHHHHHPHHQHHSHQNHHLRKSMKKTGSAGQASPLLWAKTKPTTSEIDEPTSPKVTCAGQIKVRHKPDSSCKNWQSVMEEIERIHNSKKQKKKNTWVETLGFKKEVMQFLTCLRSVKLDFRCFGAFPSSDITSDDDEDDDDEDEDDFQHIRNKKEEKTEDSESSKTVFSKWFMVLQENVPNENFMNSYKFSDESFSIDLNEEGVNDFDDYEPCAPPSNALMLMRSSSAPAKTWLEEMEEQDHDEEADADEEDDEEEEKKKEKEISESLVLMKYNKNEFDMLSSDIVKETWVVGGIKDALSRSRSWKR